MNQEDNKKVVEVEVQDSGQMDLAKEAPDIEIKTGLTDGKKYFIKIRPRNNTKPVLIAVHI